MGLIEDRFKDSMSMNKRSKTYTSPFGVLNSETGELILRKEPVVTNSEYSLKDITYFIENGILYVSAKKLEWGYIRNYLFSLSDWSPKDNLYISTPYFLTKFKVPDKYLLAMKIRVKWYKRKQPKTMIDCRPNDRRLWFQEKEEIEFSYSLHPFKLREE